MIRVMSFIVVPPTVYAAVDVVHKDLHENVRLTCTIEAWPAPKKVTWMYNNVAIQDRAGKYTFVSASERYKSY